MNNEVYFSTLANSLRRSIKYYQGSLSKLKKNRKFKTSTFLTHKKELERCQAALKRVVDSLTTLSIKRTDEIA
jgi:membrane protein DedA with SNARE-associated domain